MKTQIDDQLKAAELVLDEMDAILTAFGSSMKQFWIKKKEALTLLQAAPSSIKKSILWKRYKDLAKQALQLTKFRDSDASFHIDQIRTCINDLKDQWQAFDTLKGKVNTNALMPYLVGKENHLKNYKELYMQMQVLAPLVYRIPRLRKDLLALESSFGVKKEVFNAISVLADEVFAKKKGIIDEAQALIKEDLDAIEKQVEGTDVKLCFKLFKALQFIAKEMHLPQNLYKAFRERFSTIWERLALLKKESQLKEEKSEMQAKKSADTAKAQRAAKEKKQQERKLGFEKLVAELNKQCAKKKRLDQEVVASLLEEQKGLVLDFKETLLWCAVGIRLESAQIALQPASAEYSLRNKLALAIKKEIDTLRREMGSASIDIEKGLVYQEQKAVLVDLFESEVDMIKKIRDKNS